MAGSDQRGAGPFSTGQFLVLNRAPFAVGACCSRAFAGFGHAGSPILLFDAHAFLSVRRLSSAFRSGRGRALYRQRLVDGVPTGMPGL